jgi:hypothetical protein
MLHHMGLQDEYPEESAELKDKWNCRPTTREDSVMYYHTYGLDAAVPSTILCGCNTNACENLVAHPDTKIIKMLTSVPGWPMNPEFQRQYCQSNYTILRSNPNPLQGLRIDSDSGDTFKATYHSWHPNNLTANYVPTEMVLTCTCHDDACRTMKNEMLKKVGTPSPTTKYCPVGFQQVSKKWDRGSYPTGIHDGLLRFSTTPVRDTILYPNQFKRAVAGKCEENIAGYGMCSEYAYKGSRTNQCETPDACRNPDYYLGTFPKK